MNTTPVLGTGPDAQLQRASRLAVSAHDRIDKLQAQVVELATQLDRTERLKLSVVSGLLRQIQGVAIESLHIVEGDDPSMQTILARAEDALAVIEMGGK